MSIGHASIARSVSLRQPAAYRSTLAHAILPGVRPAGQVPGSPDDYIGGPCPGLANQFLQTPQAQQYAIQNPDGSYSVIHRDFYTALAQANPTCSGFAQAMRTAFDGNHSGANVAVTSVQAPRFVQWLENNGNSCDSWGQLPPSGKITLIRQWAAAQGTSPSGQALIPETVASQATAGTTQISNAAAIQLSMALDTYCTPSGPTPYGVNVAGGPGGARTAVGGSSSTALIVVGVLAAGAAAIWYRSKQAKE